MYQGTLFTRGLCISTLIIIHIIAKKAGRAVHCPVGILVSCSLSLLFVPKIYLKTAPLFMFLFLAPFHCHLRNLFSLLHCTHPPHTATDTLRRAETMHAFLEKALSLNGTLSTKERKKRTLLFMYCIFAGPLVTFQYAATTEKNRNRYLGLICGVLSVLTCACVVVMILCRRRLTHAFTVAVLYIFAFCVFLWDLDARTIGTAEWPLLVIVVDMLLVMQVPTRYTVGLVCFSMFWLVLLGLEESYRFGLFDVPWLTPQGGEHGRRATATQTSCEALPCPVSFPPRALSSGLAVFLLDFIATRGFARDVLKEQATMQRTINTVQDIASLLAGYDVEKVAELLEEHGGDLPEGMTTALRKLEQNLRVYKAYLPKTCLPFEDEKEHSMESIGKEQCPDNDTASVSHSSSATERKHSKSIVISQVAASPLVLSSTKATLLTLNIKDTLRHLEEDSARFSQLFASLLLKTLQATVSWRGMVDVFVGDRIHCSFNASKQCGSHATSALHAANALMQGTDGVASHANVGVASGKVLRGDMGCDVMRRFSMVGSLVRDVHGMERAGRVFGCDVVCNRLCFSDAECEHSLRLLPCKVEVARDCEPEVVAELAVQTQAPAAAVVDEWMYQIGEKKDWEDYNQAVRKYLKGEVAAHTVEGMTHTGAFVQTPARVTPASVKGGVLFACQCATSVPLSCVASLQ